MTFKEKSEKSSETEQQLSDLKDLIDLLQLQLDLQREILDDKKRHILMLVNNVERYFKQNLYLASESVRLQGQVRDAKTIVALLLERIKYEQSLNQNYLRNTIEGRETPEVNLANNWLNLLNRELSN